MLACSVRHSLFPIVGFAACVSNRNHLSYPWLLSVNQCERKPFHYLATRPRRIGRADGRERHDSFHRGIEFVDEGFRRSRILSGVPIVGRSRFCECVVVKADILSRHLPRNNQLACFRPRNRLGFSRVEISNTLRYFLSPRRFNTLVYHFIETFDEGTRQRCPGLCRKLESCF